MCRRRRLPPWLDSSRRAAREREQSFSVVRPASQELKHVGVKERGLSREFALGNVKWCRVVSTER